MVVEETDRGLRAILVVDDDPDCLKSTLEALASYWSVLSATNGRDAVNIAQVKRPAAIVLDVMLAGGRDGFTVFKELGEDPFTRDIPVIFLTSVGECTGLPFGSADLKQYLGREPAAFLEKPVAADALVQQVAKATGTGNRRTACPQ